ncbi:FtsX-like permease family protein [Actinomadura sp. LOL_016]|uniref:FtsX-like permease family protein n=1 Tax=Actinomadura sp. LOL_016 TaxID=3345411 RepID=UPI003A8A5B4F
MGRCALVLRLALRDLRRRPAQGVLLLLAIAATAATLTLGLLVRGAADDPWERTRAATAGPDAVAAAPDAGTLAALAREPGVAEAGRPYPTLSTVLRSGDAEVAAVVHGRDAGADSAGLDRPHVTSGHWAAPGTVVVERAFAEALDVRPGDAIVVGGRRLPVAGIAVTTGRAPYPSSTPGLVWTTRADAAGLDARERSWTMPLRLTDPAAAPAFAARHDGVRSAQDIAVYATAELRLADRALLGGTWALAILAGLCVALLVGGRLAEQGRRVGLLKAAGATPALVAAVLLAEHLVVALAGGVAGILAGWAASPLLTGPNAGLLGAASAPVPTPGVVAAVLLAALAVTAASTAVPALRGARVRTARALSRPVRGPGRRSRLVALSSGLPVPLLLGVRIAARRPRRTFLAAASTAVTAGMLVAALALHRQVEAKDAGAVGPGFVPGAGNPVTERVGQIMLVLSLGLLLLAAVNAILTAWTTALDTSRTAALVRAVGATPRQVASGLAAAQLLPASVAALAGVPLGLLVHRAALALGGGGAAAADVPAPWLAAVVPCTLAAVALLTAVPARRAASRPVARVL